MFVGAGATLVPGVRVESRCVVGAAAAVTRPAPDDSVVAGPARSIMTYQELIERMRRWPRAADMRGATHRQRVDSVVGVFRPPMEPAQVRQET